MLLKLATLYPLRRESKTEKLKAFHAVINDLATAVHARTPASPLVKAGMKELTE